MVAWSLESRKGFQGRSESGAALSTLGRKTGENKLKGWVSVPCYKVFMNIHLTRKKKVGECLI